LLKKIILALVDGEPFRLVSVKSPSDSSSVHVNAMPTKKSGQYVRRAHLTLHILFFGTCPISLCTSQVEQASNYGQVSQLKLLGGPVGLEDQLQFFS